MSEPSLLWHYTTLETLGLILKTKVLLASDFQDLNDASEFNYGIGLLRKFFGEQGLTASQKDAEQIQFEEGVLLDVETRLSGQVICFSTANDKLSMWRGYGRLANGGQPVAIGFHRPDLEVLVQNQSLVGSRFRGPLKVEYGSARIPRMSIAPPNKSEATCPNQHMKWVAQLNDFVKILKHDGFQEEEEWRLMCDGSFGGFEHKFGSFEQIGCQFRKKFHLTMGEELYSSQMKYPLAIKELKVGPKVDQSYVERFCQNYFSLHSCERPNITKSRIPFV